MQPLQSFNRGASTDIDQLTSDFAPVKSAFTSLRTIFFTMIFWVVLVTLVVVALAIITYRRWRRDHTTDAFDTTDSIASFGTCSGVSVRQMSKLEEESLGSNTALSFRSKYDTGSTSSVDGGSLPTATLSSLNETHTVFTKPAWYANNCLLWLSNYINSMIIRYVQENLCSSCVWCIGMHIHCHRAYFLAKCIFITTANISNMTMMLTNN